MRPFRAHSRNSQNGFIIAARHALVPAVLLTAALALTGCASAHKSSSANLTGPEKDKMYTALVKAQVNDIPDGVDLPGVGRSLCHALNVGASIDEIADDILQKGAPRDYTLAILAVAPPTYCPKFNAKMTAWVAAQ